MRERKESELIAIVKIKDLATYILQISAKSPVKYRYSILNHLINICLEMIELSFKANNLDRVDINRLELLRSVRAKLPVIDFLSSIAVNVKCFTNKQYDTLTAKIGDCDKYLNGWINATRKTLAI